jgi:RNA-directed DNA polymerase
VTDRLIQQALRQVVQPIVDPTFSEHSYGFRPGRRAHDAVLAAQSYVQSGRWVVVDVDLEKFFGRVDHDMPPMATSNFPTYGQSNSPR